MKIFLLLSVCFILASCSPKKLDPPREYTWYVRPQSVPLRAEPTQTGRIIKTLFHNFAVLEILRGPEIISTEPELGHWLFVKNADTSGWVPSTNLTSTLLVDQPLVSRTSANQCCMDSCKARNSLRADCTKDFLTAHPEMAIACDCGEDCAGNPTLAALRHGWTPTAEDIPYIEKHTLDWPEYYKPFPYSCYDFDPEKAHD